MMKYDLNYKTNRRLLGLFSSFFLLNSSALLAEEKEIDPYALTSSSVQQAKLTPLILNPDGINALAPNLGKSTSIKPRVANYMILWSSVRKAGAHQVEWEVIAPADGTYAVTLVGSGNGSKFSVSSGIEKEEVTIEGKGWLRTPSAAISLKKGSNSVKLDVEATKDFSIGSIELTQPEVKEKLLNEALAERTVPDWFKDAGYGLMFQWTNRATPPQGDIKAWEQKVNDFDLDAYIDLVEESGAAYVVWSITWGNQYISAPCKALDQIIKGRTTKRDLLAEMADRLEKKGVKLIFYYHYGYHCYHSSDDAWLEASGALKPDKAELYKNVMNIITEVGERYGDKLGGWWFDGGARFYNCHFDGSSGAAGMLSAPFKAFTEASRKGNPERMISYNSWIKPRITEYQDYYGGEGRRSFKAKELENGVFKSGRQKGLQAHGCFPLEKRWGHIDKDTLITPPNLPLNRLVYLVKKAKINRYPLSLNLEMYEDGTVSPASKELLKGLKAEVRK